MSSYIYFYVRKEDTFIPIGEFSRNNEIYQVFNEYNDAPYEKIVEAKFSSPIANLEEKKIKYQAAIMREVQAIEDLKTINAPLDEITERIWERRNSIESLREDIKEIDWTINRLKFYRDINDDYYGVKVYVGIESGDSVTKEDIDGYGE